MTTSPTSELEHAELVCLVLKGDDFKELRLYCFDRYCVWLRERNGIHNREEEEAQLKALVVWCKHMIHRCHVAPHHVARQGVVVARGMLKLQGGFVDHHRELEGNVNESHVPSISYLQTLFAKAIVDLCFVRGYLNDAD